MTVDGRYVRMRVNNYKVRVKEECCQHREIRLDEKEGPFNRLGATREVRGQVRVKIRQ